ncbi:MAG: hypothetical protein AB7F67_00275 [Rhodospirillaceae bacterium]
MTASSARRPGAARAALAAAAFAAGLLGAAAAAQDAPGPPVRLVPARPGAAPAPPAAAAPAPTVTPRAAPPDGPAAASSPARPGRSIEAVPLGAPDPDSVGTLDTAQGGFGVDMWAETDRAVVEALLPALPEASSRAAAAMARRLLLSRAVAPAGARGDGVPAGARGESLLALRAERLIAMADARGAAALLAAAPRSDDERLSLAEAEALFLAKDENAACARVRAAPRSFASPYWQQADAFCLALTGDHARAALSASVLRERSREVPEGFFALIEALGGDKRVEVGKLEPPRALYGAMLRAAAVKPPRALAESRSPLLLRAVAESAAADPEQRLEAAERAARLGILSPEELVAAYEAVTLDANEMADPLTAAARKWGPRARALLLRAVSVQVTPQAKASLLKAALDLARGRDGRDVLLLGAGVGLRGLRPEQSVAPVAADAARALMLGGRIDDALAWVRLARDGARFDRDVAAAWQALVPLVLIAEPDDDPVGDKATIDRALALPADADAAAVRRQFLRLAALDGFERAIGTPRWLALSRAMRAAPVAALADPALLLALREAAAEGRVGETVLLALVVLGGDGAAAVQPPTLNAVVAALRTAGLEAEAQAIALETMILAGD